MSGIDFNDLSSRVISEEPIDAPAAPEPEAVEEAVEETAPEAPVEEEVAEESAAEDAVEEPVAEQPSEWQVRYDEAQKVIGRQGQELGELRKAIEAIQAQAQQPAEPEGPSFGTWQPTTQDELLDGAADPYKAVDAYNFAVQHAPDLLPEVLAEVRVHDPAMAERMQLDYYQHLLQSQVAPVQETQAQAHAQAQVASVVSSVVAEYEAQGISRDDLAAIIEEEDWLIGDGSPEAVQRGIRAAARMVQQQRQVAAQYDAVQKAQAVQQRRAAAVETGTAGAAPPVEDVSEADAIRNAIFEEDRRRREALG